jgi:hypothetical protein
MWFVKMLFVEKEPEQVHHTLLLVIECLAVSLAAVCVVVVQA